MGLFFILFYDLYVVFKKDDDVVNKFYFCIVGIYVDLSGFFLEGVVLFEFWCIRWEVLFFVDYVFLVVEYF